jgi:hypothetical protein
MLIVFFQFALFFSWLMFCGMGRHKACPDCGKSLPRLQSPFTKTKRQWFEGGYLCQHCGCETDLAGAKIATGTAPSLRSLIVGVGLLTPTVIPAIVLLTLLLRR